MSARCATCFPPAACGPHAGAHPGDRYLSPRTAFEGADIVHSQDLGFWYSMQAAKYRRELGYKLVLTVWETIPFLDAYRNVRTRPYRRRVLDGRRPVPAPPSGRGRAADGGRAAGAHPGGAAGRGRRAVRGRGGPEPPDVRAPDRLGRPSRLGEGAPGRPARVAALRRGDVEGRPCRGC